MNWKAILKTVAVAAASGAANAAVAKVTANPDKPGKVGKAALTGAIIGVAALLLKPPQQE